MDDIMVDAKRRILKVTQQEAAGFDTATNAETDPPGGGAAPDRRRTLDVYDCVVSLWNRTGISGKQLKITAVIFRPAQL